MALVHEGAWRSGQLCESLFHKAVAAIVIGTELAGDEPLQVRHRTFELARADGARPRGAGRADAGDRGARVRGARDDDGAGRVQPMSDVRPVDDHDPDAPVRPRRKGIYILPNLFTLAAQNGQLATADPITQAMLGILG